MLTLVLGGARSGKSRYAQSLCEGRNDVVFVATASIANDPEMAERVARHREGRPRHWKTVEAPLDPVSVLRGVDPSDGVFLVDCITLWLANLLYELRDLSRLERESRTLGQIESFAEASRAPRVIAVSNEVGGGIVPETPLAREFRDLQGQANQKLARAAERVFWMVAGIPVSIRG